jgi:hypothetical protein
MSTTPQFRSPSLPKKGWFFTEWTAAFEGHEILVRNSWTNGIRLFVDGQQVAKNRELFALDKNSPVLSARVARDEGEPFLLEVFSYALVSVRVKIVADGQQIGGEEL